MRTIQKTIAIALIIITAACAAPTEPVVAKVITTPTTSFSFTDNTNAWLEWPINWPSQCSGNSYTGTARVHVVGMRKFDGWFTYYREHLNFAGTVLTDQNGREYVMQNIESGGQLSDPTQGSAAYEYRYRIIPKGPGPRVMEIMTINIQISWVNPDTFNVSSTAKVECK